MAQEGASNPTTSGRVLDVVAGIFLWVGALGVLILMVLTVVGVLWRYGFNDPIFGISDLSTLTLTVVAASAVAYGAAKQGHVSVSVITMFFGRKVTRLSDLVMRLASIFVAGLAAYALFTRACGFEKACITTNLSLEHWPFYYVLAVSMLFVMLVFIVHLAVGIINFAGTDPNEPPE